MLPDGDGLADIDELGLGLELGLSDGLALMLEEGDGELLGELEGLAEMEELTLEL